MSDSGWFVENANGIGPGSRSRPEESRSVGVLRNVRQHDESSARDWYDKDYYADSPLDDPTGPLGGPCVLLRGQNWGSRSGKVGRGCVYGLAGRAPAMV